MKKMILWGVVVGLVVLILAATITVAFFLDGIVKKGVEAVGPKITGVSIKLDEMHIGLLTGSARVKGLLVGNPDGYKTPSAISVGLAEVGVDPFSVFSDKIVIRSIVVEAPEITFEGGLGANNLGKIMENVNSVAQAGGPPSTNTTTKAAAKPAKKFEVDDFLITGAKVHISLTGIGGKEITLPLPEIHLTNLGKDGAGITATDLTRRTLNALTTATAKVVSKAITDLGRNAANMGVSKIKNGLGGLFGN